MEAWKGDEMEAWKGEETQKGFLHSIDMNCREIQLRPAKLHNYPVKKIFNN